MPPNHTPLINSYLQKVKSANKEATKKEAFKDLLNRLYAGVKDIEPVIDKITIGAEASELTIKRDYKIYR